MILRKHNKTLIEKVGLRLFILLSFILFAVFRFSLISRLYLTARNNRSVSYTFCKAVRTAPPQDLPKPSVPCGIALLPTALLPHCPLWVFISHVDPPRPGFITVLAGGGSGHRAWVRMATPMQAILLSPSQCRLWRREELPARRWE